MNILIIILGIISIAYDATIILLNPGTFLDIVFSFTHIWPFLLEYLEAMDKNYVCKFVWNRPDYFSY